MYNQNKTVGYYLSLLGEDIIIYMTSLTRREIPFSILILFALGFLLVPLTKIDKKDVISGLLYGCYGMFSAAIVFFMPSNYLNKKEYLAKVTLYLFALFSLNVLMYIQ